MGIGRQQSECLSRWKCSDLKGRTNNLGAHTFVRKRLQSRAKCSENTLSSHAREVAMAKLSSQSSSGAEVDSVPFGCGERFRRGESVADFELFDAGFQRPFCPPPLPGH